MISLILCISGIIADANKKGSSRLSGERRLDLQKEIGG
jgi:hypothetical protein